MEKESMLPFLPQIIKNKNKNKDDGVGGGVVGDVVGVEEAMRSVTKGPEFSHVNSGESLFHLIQCINRPTLFSPSTSLGYSLFFDDQLMARAEATRWFGEVVPCLANLVLRLPCLLNSHYQTTSPSASLRFLPPHQHGIVFLSQELIAALLACSFFCLFPDTHRDAHHLPLINFHNLFQNLHNAYSEKQEHKIMCILHYFHRISSSMPRGFVSFERKVLPLHPFPSRLSYPTPDFWSHSLLPLSHFEARHSINRHIF